MVNHYKNGKYTVKIKGSSSKQIINKKALSQHSDETKDGLGQKALNALTTTANVAMKAGEIGLKVTSVLGTIAALTPVKIGIAFVPYGTEIAKWVSNIGSSAEALQEYIASYRKKAQAIDLDTAKVLVRLHKLQEPEMDKKLDKKLTEQKLKFENKISQIKGKQEILNQILYKPQIRDENDESHDNVPNMVKLLKNDPAALAKYKQLLDKGEIRQPTDYLANREKYFVNLDQKPQHKEDPTGLSQLERDVLINALNLDEKQQHTLKGFKAPLEQIVRSRKLTPNEQESLTELFVLDKTQQDKLKEIELTTINLSDTKSAKEQKNILIKELSLSELQQLILNNIGLENFVGNYEGHKTLNPLQRQALGAMLKLSDEQKSTMNQILDLSEVSKILMTISEEEKARLEILDKLLDQEVLENNVSNKKETSAKSKLITAVSNKIKIDTSLENDLAAELDNIHLELEKLENYKKEYINFQKTKIANPEKAKITKASLDYEQNENAQLMYEKDDSDNKYNITKSSRSKDDRIKRHIDELINKKGYTIEKVRKFLDENEIPFKMDYFRDHLVKPNVVAKVRESDAWTIENYNKYTAKSILAKIAKGLKNVKKATTFTLKGGKILLDFAKDLTETNAWKEFENEAAGKKVEDADFEQIIVAGIDDDYNDLTATRVTIAKLVKIVAKVQDYHDSGFAIAENTREIADMITSIFQQELENVKDKNKEGIVKTVEAAMRSIGVAIPLTHIIKENTAKLNAARAKYKKDNNTDELTKELEAITVKTKSDLQTELERAEIPLMKKVFGRQTEGFSPEEKLYFNSLKNLEKSYEEELINNTKKNPNYSIDESVARFHRTDKVSILQKTYYNFLDSIYEQTSDFGKKLVPHINTALNNHPSNLSDEDLAAINFDSGSTIAHLVSEHYKTILHIGEEGQLIEQGVVDQISDSKEFKTLVDDVSKLLLIENRGISNQTVLLYGLSNFIRDNEVIGGKYFGNEILPTSYVTYKRLIQLDKTGRRFEADDEDIYNDVSLLSRVTSFFNDIKKNITDVTKILETGMQSYEQMVQGNFDQAVSGIQGVGKEAAKIIDNTKKSLTDFQNLTVDAINVAAEDGKIDSSLASSLINQINAKSKLAANALEKTEQCTNILSTVATNGTNILNAAQTLVQNINEGTVDSSIEQLISTASSVAGDVHNVVTTTTTLANDLNIISDKKAQEIKNAVTTTKHVINGALDTTLTTLMQFEKTVDEVKSYIDGDNINERIDLTSISNIASTAAKVISDTTNKATNLVQEAGLIDENTANNVTNKLGTVNNFLAKSQEVINFIKGLENAVKDGSMVSLSGEIGRVIYSLIDTTVNQVAKQDVGDSISTLQKKVEEAKDKYFNDITNIINTDGTNISFSQIVKLIKNTKASIDEAIDESITEAIEENIPQETIEQIKAIKNTVDGITQVFSNIAEQGQKLIDSGKELSQIDIFNTTSLTKLAETLSNIAGTAAKTITDVTDHGTTLAKKAGFINESTADRINKTVNKVNDFAAKGQQAVNTVKLIDGFVAAAKEGSMPNLATQVGNIIYSLIETVVNQVGPQAGDSIDTLKKKVEEAKEKYFEDIKNIISKADNDANNAISFSQMAELIQNTKQSIDEAIKEAIPSKILTEHNIEQIKAIKNTVDSTTKVFSDIAEQGQALIDNGKTLSDVDIFDNIGSIIANLATTITDIPVKTATTTSNTIDEITNNTPAISIKQVDDTTHRAELYNVNETVSRLKKESKLISKIIDANEKTEVSEVAKYLTFIYEYTLITNFVNTAHLLSEKDIKIITSNAKFEAIVNDIASMLKADNIQGSTSTHADIVAWGFSRILNLSNNPTATNMHDDLLADNTNIQILDQNMGFSDRVLSGNTGDEDNH